MMGRSTKPVGVVGTLTDRELQVFRLAGRAVSTRGIAEKLGVSVKTVEAHRENIKGKIGVDTHTALVARAAQWLRDSGPLRIDRRRNTASALVAAFSSAIASPAGRRVEVRERLERRVADDDVKKIVVVREIAGKGDRPEKSL